jgi:hypothetical protein
MTLTMRVDNTSPDRTPLARWSWQRAANMFADSMDPAITAGLRARAPVAPVNGGAYKKSIRCERTSSTGLMTLKFGSSLPYAPYVVEPTKPHTIVPRSARALRFVFYGHAPGALVFTKRVEHPGTRGNDFPKTVLTVMGPEIRDALLGVVALVQGG